MTVQRLAAAVNRPDVHRKVLGGYTGPYSLGVTRAASNTDDGALLLRIAGTPPPTIPSEIALDGETIPIVIKGGFIAPQAL